MKRVDTIARVRRAFYVQGWSMKRIVRELHVSRNTVRKILRTDETDFSYERERQPMPRIGPWQGQLEQFLSSNACKPSRERLTLIRIFEELRGLGYEGGYDAVRRFAKGWSQNRGAVTAEAYVPLYYAPGEAYQLLSAPSPPNRSCAGLVGSIRTTPCTNGGQGCAIAYLMLISARGPRGTLTGELRPAPLHCHTDLSVDGMRWQEGQIVDEWQNMDVNNPDGTRGGRCSSKEAVTLIVIASHRFSSALGERCQT